MFVGADPQEPMGWLPRITHGISGTGTMPKIKVPEFVLTKLTFVAKNVLHLPQHTVDILLRNF